MPEECPRCQKPTVRRSAGFWKHLYRLLAGSDKRYCTSCEKRWIVETAGPA
jgi:transposase-like protein